MNGALVLVVIVDMMEKRLRLELCKNLRITSLSQNLLVLIKACILFRIHK